MSEVSRPGRWGMRTLALGYLALLIVFPLMMIFYKTFEHRRWSL